ncbi:MAG: signal recognition particle-docking protein FtsY, partial [Actinobacteria bacterium]|nr:signal recognition particle-docking protein FtsY [Actinomycetota bacterium]
WESIEEILLSADVGVSATLKIIDNLKDKAKKEGIKEPSELLTLIQKELMNILSFNSASSQLKENGLAVIIIVGVNGVGKTTTIGKIAHQLVSANKKVLIAAADTFRAAAIEQLEVWGERVGVEVIKHQRKADPAAVVYDAVHAAKARDIDVLLIDTAGRLHTHVNLMEELKKVKRVAEREAGDAIIETFLVLDATTGQNGLSQAKLFNEALNIDGLVLTKLDGTARGGIVVAIVDELRIPVKLVGVGEGMEDLHEFYPEDFVEALLAPTFNG